MVKKELPKILYDALKLQKETDQDPLDVFKSFRNKTCFGVKSRRVGGANYQIPIEVNDERSQAWDYVG